MAMIEVVHNGLVKPNPGGQMDFANDWSHYMVGLEGGWMSGKTWIGARKLVTLHLFNAFDWEGNPTYVPSVVVAPSYSNLFDFDVPEIQDALDEAGLAYKWKAQGPIAGGKFSGPAVILPELGTTKNPSVILFRSADTPEKITGWQVGASLGDEPARWKEDRINPKNDAFIQLMGRVRHPRARKVQAYFTYTNEGDETMIYEQMNSGRADIALYRAPTSENPKANFFLEKQKHLLTPALIKQYLEGGAASLRGGKVYPSYDKALHVTKDVELIKDLPLQMSLDFNIAPGMHALLGQYIPWEDTFTVVHEIFAPRLSVRGVVRELEWWLKKQGGYIWPGQLEIYGDASGHSAHAGTGESCYDILTEGLNKIGVSHHVLKVPKANPPVIDRINTVEIAMLDFNDENHYRIHPRCRELVTDFQKMKRDHRGAIDTRDPTLGHSADAEGYRIYYQRPVRKYKPIKGKHSVTILGD